MDSRRRRGAAQELLKIEPSSLVEWAAIGCSAASIVLVVEADKLVRQG